MLKTLETVLKDEYSIESEIYPEPVEEWSRHNLLANAIQFPFAFLFELQIRIMTSLFKQRSKHHKKKITIFERSLHTAKNVFQSLYFDNASITSSEVETLNSLYDTFMKEKPHLDKSTNIIYINLSPKECLDRVQKRINENQSSNIESDRGITEDYLQKLDKKYKEVMNTYNNKKLLILDGSLDPLTLAQHAASFLLKTSSLSKPTTGMVLKCAKKNHIESKSDDVELEQKKTEHTENNIKDELV